MFTSSAAGLRNAKTIMSFSRVRAVVLYFDFDSWLGASPFSFISTNKGPSMSPLTFFVPHFDYAKICIHITQRDISALRWRGYTQFGPFLVAIPPCSGILSLVSSTLQYC